MKHLIITEKNKKEKLRKKFHFLSFVKYIQTLFLNFFMPRLPPLIYNSTVGRYFPGYLWGLSAQHDTTKRGLK